MSRVRVSGNPEQTRILNRSLILRQLSCEDPLSRIDIAKALDLSKMTVSVIISDLINEGLVDEIGEGEAARSGGRKPILLALSRKTYVLGFDVGETNTSVLLSNLRSKTIDETTVPTSRDKTVQRIVRQLKDLANEILERNDVDNKTLLGIGVSTAGLIDKQDGHILFSPDFNWKDIPFRSHLEEAMGLPVVIDNCTRVMALGETRYGGAKESESLLFVNVGHGIGSALLVNGRIYEKNSEFGHVRATSRPVLCDCGKNGCLEAVASGHAIEKMNYEQNGSKGNWITAKELADAANQGDESAVKLFRDAGRYLGRSISVAVNLFNPDKVIIGGGVTRSGSLLMDSLMTEFRKDTMEIIKDTTSVELTTLGMLSGVCGAVALALETFLFSIERRV